MHRTASEFVANEVNEAKMAKPGAKILCFEGRDLRDSMPISPADVSRTGRYDLICVDNLIEKLRTSDKAQELMAALFSGLGPGGRLLVGSLPEDAPDARDLRHLGDLTSRIPDDEIRGQAVFRDPASESLFFEIYKTAA